MKLNPLLSANPVSKLFFCWLNGLLKKGYGQTLDVTDLFDVCPEDKSEILGNDLEKVWTDELKKSSGRKQDASLLKTLFRMFGLQYIMITALLFIEEASKVVQPVLLGGLITYFTPEPGISQADAYLYAMGVSLCAILQAVLYHPYSFFVYRLGMRIRVACCSLIYRKSLRLSNSGFSKTTTGQIVNLMSNDVNKIDLCVTLLPFLFVGPLQAVAVIAILWNKIGKPMLAGVAVLVILVVIQTFMSRLFSNLRLRTAKYTDKRVTVMNEIIAGMRIIKMYCWENSFRDLVAGIRRCEIHNVKMTSYLSAFLETISRNGRYFCIYATVLFYVLSNDQFRASELYIIVGLLNALSMHALLFVSLAIKHAVQTNVTFRRITSFLKLEETSTYLQYNGNGLISKDNSDVVEAKHSPINTEESIPLIVCNDNLFIKIAGVTATWDETAERPTLQNVSATVTEGQLVAVIGQVGSGKSSLLLAILRELPLTDGTIRHSGRLAYVSQQAWVFSSTIKENIIYGCEFDQQKYNNIIRACALDKDIALLPHGDDTLIGDRGVKLSGGQRARISLARALYMDGDIYLLDDPFSAVDTNVAKHISENVIQGLLKNKPKILVTHSQQFLSAADNIIILKQGEVFASGTFEALSHTGIEFASFLTREEKDGENKSTVSNPFPRDHELQSPKKAEIMQMRRKSNAMYIGLEKTKLSNATKEMKPKSDIGEDEKDERYQTGTVNWRVYLNYIKSGTGFIKGMFLTILCLAAQVTFIGSDWWLSRWSNENEANVAKMNGDGVRNISKNTTITLNNSNFHLAIYSGLLAGILVFGLLRAFLFFQVTVKAGETLHNTMFNSLIRARISFFDTNPVGRVLNRFSKDLGQIDEVLPLTLFDFLQCLLIIVGMVIMTGVVNPWVFIAIVPLAVLLILVRHYYLQTSRQLQRLEGVTRSPVFSHLSATLQGLHTIRAFGSQKRLIKEFDTYQDVHSSAWFLFVCTARWLTARLDWLCALFVTTVSFASVLAVGSLDAGFVGFSLTYAFAVMGIFQWTVRQSTSVENQMVSVERILDYCKLQSEAPLKSNPVENWPTEGEVSTSNVCLKYFDDSPYILQNLTMKINAREKVGIVGRTGAGKSSIITMFMRLVEYEGSVKIDGVNIQDIGLHDLRNRISVIPQDPVLFTGKLRRNLDPFGEHGDEALWQVLEAIEMKETIEALPLGLETEVFEGGINFSVGQRQLICLARAMLRNNKILIIDEATANVDTRTDFLIQRTIRERFDRCTVLTIAHRLYTVMDSDRLMVLDQGHLMEFDQPLILMQRKEGFLHKLVGHMGHDNIRELLHVAETAYNRKYHSEPVMDNKMTDRKSGKLQL